MHFSQIASLTGLYTPSLRLGVTGLSRAGKTVFITSLIRNLTAGGRLPFFAAKADGRLIAAFLQPQPDDALPRFDYEAHLARLSAQPPQWPESTRQISQLRLSLHYTPATTFGLDRLSGPAKLNLDIIDYPGEWLLDLALLDSDFSQWSREALGAVRSLPASSATKSYLSFIGEIDGGNTEDEAAAIKGAQLYSQLLVAARATGEGMATLGPGRFLTPGDLAGSPLLTFFPLETTAPIKRGSLAAMLERRYQSYRRHVVVPFFQDHFSRLDRQIVIVDALSAINAGQAGLTSLENALTTVLKAFRPGLNSWWSALFQHRIDKVLFAATKADHLHHNSHDRLEGVLRLLTERARVRVRGTGAEVGVLAISAVRATREAQAMHEGERLACIAGVPAAGQVIGETHFDGTREAAIFPGDLPADPGRIVDGAVDWPAGGPSAFIRFQPPVMRAASAGELTVPPHIRLDRAIEFLIGDWLT